MPASRYIDWTHVRVIGDRAVAAPHVPYARKLLGYVIEDAACQQLGMASAYRELEDGTVVIAEKHGEIPRITIITGPGEEEEPPRRLPDDFVVWARDSAHPAGIDQVSPQQILRTPEREGEGWRTYFYEADTEGHSAFPGQKGTYRSQFSDGIPQAGNLDWLGPDGERLSWYGPSTRYWYEPYVQMEEQYGRQVFMLGQVVFDCDRYIEDSSTEPAAEPDFVERYVLGAARRGLWLYVVQAQPHRLTVPIPDPAQVVAPNTVYTLLSPSCTPYEVSTVFCRYRLRECTDGNQGAEVVPKTRQVLWSGELARGVSPWFFDQMVTEGCAFAPPNEHRYGYAHATIAETTTPLHRLNISYDAGTGEPTAEYRESAVSSCRDADAVLAADYDESGECCEILLRRRSATAAPEQLIGQAQLLVVGDAEIRLRGLEQLGPDPVFGYRYRDTRRWLMWADARADTAVLRRQEVVFRDPPGGEDPFLSMQVWLEVWMGGRLVSEQTDEDTAIGTDHASFGIFNTYDTNFADRQSEYDDIAPWLCLYGWNVGTGSLGSLTIKAGAHAGNNYLPRQRETYFGYLLTGRVTTAGVNVPEYAIDVQDQVNAVPASMAPDFQGRDSVLGCAARRGVLVLSAYSKAAGYKPAETAVVSGDGATLPRLTGIEGEHARYHPIWLLGQALQQFE